MFITCITRQTPAYVAHADLAAAQRYIVTETNGDYWITPDGVATDTRRMRDYAATIYPNLTAALMSVTDLDPDAAARCLREIADVIADYDA